MIAHGPLPRRYLITGGAGFIGSHLAEALLEQGHFVTVIDDLSTGRFENVQPLVQRRYSVEGHDAFRFAIDSITNEMVLDRLASESDTIVHLAAAVGVQLIVNDPVHTIETNIMGTEAVLRAALRYRSKVLLASTSEVYGRGCAVPFREDDDVLLGPTSRSRWAYAASKMVDEFLALAYHRQKGIPVVVARLFNTVGPRQTGRYGMVVPRLVRQALAGEPLTVFGDGGQSRCFLHVADAVEALIGLLNADGATGRVFNVGSTEEVTIRELAERILSRVGVAGARSGGGISTIPYDQAYGAGFEDMRRRVPDISRITSLSGWQPRRSLDQVLDDVIADLAGREPFGP